MTKKFKICLMMRGSHQWIGGIEYIKNIIYALNALPAQERSGLELSLSVKDSLETEFYREILQFVDSVHRDKEIKKAVQASASRLILNRFKRKKPDPWEQFIKNNGFDFIYPHTPNMDRPPYRSAAWIPDFQHRHLPELFPEELIRDRDRKNSNAAHNASRIILSSKMAETDFRRFYPEYAAKSRVFYFRTNPQPAWFQEDPKAVQRKYHLPDRFFLICNQFWKHKNHKIVLNALKYLKSDRIQPIVVCTGHVYDHRNPHYIDDFLQIIHLEGLAGQVYLLGLVPKIDQIQLMRRSVAIIQPSLFEGWSTVVEDARTLGKPIILSDIPVHKEQSPPLAMFYDKHSVDNLSVVMKEAWNQLSEGPDRKEAAALERAVKELEEMGRRFLRIASEDFSDDIMSC